MVCGQDSFKVSNAGLEIAPASINLNGGVGPVYATEFLGESTLVGMVGYAIYQFLLTGLRIEAIRTRGKSIVLFRHSL